MPFPKIPLSALSILIAIALVIISPMAAIADSPERHTPITSPPANWYVRGLQGDANFGWGLDYAGDINGDGFGDVIIGAPDYDNGDHDQAGYVFLYNGSAQGPDSLPSWTYGMEQPYANMGQSVAGSCDVNGDGYGDVVIGAPDYYVNSNASRSGAAFCFYGSDQGLSSEPDWSYLSENYNEDFGRDVACNSDINGDGFDDVIIGASSYEEPGGADRSGAIVVFYGSATGLLNEEGWRWIGDQALEHFGCSVAGAGDVNGDGFDDIIAGGNLYDDSEEDVGIARLFLGSASGLPDEADWSDTGKYAEAFFGIDVAEAGDVNQDGFGDIIVGTYNYFNVTMKGYAYLYYGSATGPSSEPDLALEGPMIDSAFGSSLNGAGDVNGDGIDDVVIGADRYANGQWQEGGAFIYLGSPGGLETIAYSQVESNQNYSYFSDPVAAGDINGDGLSDLIIGAPFWDGGANSEGAVFGYLSFLGGCNILGIRYPDGSADPFNPCKICDAAQSEDEWSDNDGAACDDGLFCNGADQCLEGSCLTHVGDPCGENTICDEESDQCLDQSTTTTTATTTTTTIPGDDDLDDDIDDDDVNDDADDDLDDDIDDDIDDDAMDDDVNDDWLDDDADEDNDPAHGDDDDDSDGGFSCSSSGGCS